MTIQIDRMELADIGNPTALAVAVLGQLGEPRFPTPIEEIAFGCGITDIKQLETKGFEGALLTTAAKADGVILVNKQNIQTRRRFTVGHELGHFLNPWHVPPDGGFMCTIEHMLSADLRQQGRLGMEAQANEFAAEILMPAALFKQQLRITRAEPSTEAIIKVADDFEVSAQAAARRMADLRKDCAIIVSHDGVICSIHRGANFPFITLAVTHAVPRKSVTKAYCGEDGAHSDVEEIEPDEWTTTSVKSGTQFLEQVLVQGKGFRLTLLVLDESECEDDEVAHERAEWKPRFHR